MAPEKRRGSQYGDNSHDRLVDVDAAHQGSIQPKEI
jgi:hypothetical protein